MASSKGGRRSADMGCLKLTGRGRLRRGSYARDNCGFGVALPKLWRGDPDCVPLGRRLVGAPSGAGARYAGARYDMGRDQPRRRFRSASTSNSTTRGMVIVAFQPIFSKAFRGSPLLYTMSEAGETYR
jgi:hypothetical protein